MYVCLVVRPASDQGQTNRRVLPAHDHPITTTFPATIMSLVSTMAASNSATASVEQSTASEASPSTNEEGCIVPGHFSSIGIEDIFLVGPRSSTTLPISYLRPSIRTNDLAEGNEAADETADGCQVTNSIGGRFLSDEIVGKVKVSPKDFVVQEIAPKIRWTDIPAELRVADVPDVPRNGRDSKGNSKVPPSLLLSSKQDSEKVMSSDNKSLAQASQTKTTHFSSNSPEDDVAVVQNEKDMPVDLVGTEKSMDPMIILQKVLHQHKSKGDAQAIMGHFKTLHERAMNRLCRCPSGPTPPTTTTTVTHGLNKDTFCIDGIPSDSSCLLPPTAGVQAGGDRGSLHRAVRVAFPLLETKTLQTNGGACDEATPNNKVAASIQAEIDTSFAGLSSALLMPERDVVGLYRFRHRGVSKTPFLSSQEDRGNNRKRKRNDGKRNNKGKHNRADHSDKWEPTEQELRQNTDHFMVLPLRSDATKDERRLVHNTVSKGTRSLQTGTIHNFRATDESDPVSAVVVRWSTKARRALTMASSKTTHVLCVVRKYQREHLSMVQQLSAAFRCRQSDIGLAGIKDMHAVTSQFCTVAHSRPNRFHQAKSFLQEKRMGLRYLGQVDWGINQGDLGGNRFRVVLRDLHRVQVERTDTGGKETMVPCQLKHLQTRITAIQTHGFLNYYGEQRLGRVGSVDTVGVRGSDVGRAMLQRDFKKAIDLLMRGRLLANNNEAEPPAVVRARQVWQKSGGDATATLKAVPNSETMSRERTVLQGLKRYDNNPHDALKCLNYSVRSFWINAYQSLVWNAMASRRMALYGASVVPGDLARNRKTGEVQLVDEKTLTDFEFSDVVLPLPGHRVQYPQNEVGRCYEAFLARDNVRFERDAPLEATAKGAYRNVVVKVESLVLNWYSDDGDVSDDRSRTDKEGAVSNVELQFELPSGSYATMMLRELMTTTIRRD